MRKLIYLLFAIAFYSCNSGSQQTLPEQDTVRQEVVDTAAAPVPEYHSNARFREVSVSKTGEHRYLISGEGQIFEANFGWVVEDGHNELKQGHQTTDAGAPEWGPFSFEIEVEKERPNSTLTLILFETSAEDGRRVHELPMALE